MLRSSFAGSVCRWLALVPLVLLAACSDKGGDNGATGSVKLPLQAAAPSGNVYQLRNATFVINGPTSTTLSTSAANDSSPLLQAALQSGSYSITLLPGWTLFRVTAAGSQPVTAVLLSANPATFTISNGQVTVVGFAFESQGDAVDFGQGTGQVIITVTERDGGMPDGPVVLQTLTLTVVGGGQIDRGPEFGGVCGSLSGASETCLTSVPAGTVMPLTVVAPAGIEFVGWGADCAAAGTAPATSVTMSVDRTCTATFAPAVLRTLTLTVVGGGQIDRGPEFGGVCGSLSGASETCLTSVPAGTVMPLTVVAPAGIEFVGWGADCAAAGTAPATSVTMSVDRTCTATFAPAVLRTLTLTVVGGGQIDRGAEFGGVCGSLSGASETCLSSAPSGTVMPLTVVAPAGVQFVGWGADCAAAGTAPTTSVTMSVDRTCTATFMMAAPTTLPLTLLVTGRGQVSSVGAACGSFTGGSQTCVRNVQVGTLVTLTPSPAGGASFLGWTGDCVPFFGTLASVTMNGPRNCSAAFSP